MSQRRHRLTSIVLSLATKDDEFDFIGEEGEEVVGECDNMDDEEGGGDTNHTEFNDAFLDDYHNICLVFFDEHNNICYA